MIAEEIRESTLEDGHLSPLEKFIPHGWSPKKTEVQKELQSY